MVPRIGDIYAALPAITGKLELEYEGEMKGADHVGRELIRTAIAKTYDEYFSGVNMQQIVQWFDLGGEIQARRQRRSQGSAARPCKRHSGPDGEDWRAWTLDRKTASEMQVSAAEFVLEGLYAHKRIGRNEERVFTAGEKQPKKPEKHITNGKSRSAARRPYN